MLITARKVEWLYLDMWTILGGPIQGFADIMAKANLGVVMLPEALSELAQDAIGVVLVQVTHLVDITGTGNVDIDQCGCMMTREAS